MTLVLSLGDVRKYVLVSHCDES